MTELDPTSKIVQRGSAKKPAARPTQARSDSGNAPVADRVTLSHKPSQASAKTETAKTSGHVRDQLVSKFRDFLEQGTYQVKADEIAKKMVQKIQDDKDQTII
jgi:flagellar biosynthesis anti-sigma factor FlgM